MNRTDTLKYNHIKRLVEAANEAGIEITLSTSVVDPFKENEFSQN